MTEKQDRERFQEMASTLIKEMKMAGFRCNFEDGTTAGFSKSVPPGTSRHIKFGYTGYRWWSEWGYGHINHSSYDELRKDVMRWVRGEW
jgi:hypothetical protein